MPLCGMPKGKAHTVVDVRASLRPASERLISLSYSPLLLGSGRFLDLSRVVNADFVRSARSDFSARFPCQQILVMCSIDNHKVTAVLGDCAYSVGLLYRLRQPDRCRAPQFGVVVAAFEDVMGIVDQGWIVGHCFTTITSSSRNTSPRVIGVGKPQRPPQVQIVHSYCSGSDDP